MIFSAKKGGVLVFVLIATAVGVIAAIIFAMIAVGGQIGEFGNGDVNASTGMGTSGYGAVSCSGVASVQSSYMPWVKDASGRYLNGDQAAIISLIQVESGWDPKAASKSSSASGLGQFITSTAKGYAEFVGGRDRSGMSWNGGKLYKDTSYGEPPDDARFAPKRSIYAASNKLGGHLRQYGDLRTAYEKGYHTYSNAKQEAAARRAGDRLMKIYNQLLNGGGCSAAAPQNMTASSPQACANAKQSVKGIDPLATCRFKLAAAKAGGSWVITQGLGNAASSAGTHLAEPGSRYTAAIDVGVAGKSRAQIETMVRSMRSEGFAAWFRSCTSSSKWCGREHIHAAYSGVRVKPILQRQLDDFVQGKNGLRGNAVDSEVPITASEKKTIDYMRRHIRI